MRLVYPITPELITLVCATCQGLEKALRRECGLSVLQYRALSHLRQNGSCGETPLASALKANMSLLSRNLGELARRGCIDSESIPKSGKTWSIEREGMRVLDDADIVLIGVYNSFFAGLDPQLHENVKACLRLTSQSQGHVRIKDGRFFDELAYFESVLPVERIITKSTSELDLPLARFRVLFELLERGPCTKASLARTLVLAPSTITWACTGLLDQDLVCLSPIATNKQRAMSLTQKGRQLAAQAVALVDRACYEMRVWAPAEREYNLRVAEFFAKSMA